MKIVVRVIGGLIALLALAVLVGWALPVGHIASRSATFQKPPSDVFAIIADVASYPSWWSELSRVEMLPPESGKIRFREHMNTGPVMMEVRESVAPSKFVTAIADPDQPFGGTWTFEIGPEAGGSRLTITERGEVYNPMFRFLSRFVFGYTATMESFLKALEARLRADVLNPMR